MPLYLVSRITQIAAVEEDRVHRGRNVTLCTAEREGDELPQQLMNRFGMTFLSAGSDIQPRKHDVLSDYTAHQEKSCFQVGNEVTRKQPEMARRIAKNL